MSGSILGQQLERHFQQSTSAAWNAVINHLSTFEGIVVDRDMVEAMNSWDLGDRHWPNVTGRQRNITPIGLITYKGANLYLDLLIDRNYQYVKVMFETVERAGLVERDMYSPTNHGYAHYLDANLPLQDTTLFEVERAAVKLTKAEVINTFAFRSDYNVTSSFGWYPNTENDVVAKENLEKRYVKRNKDMNPNILEKLETRLYDRYTRNRWPTVEAYFRTWPKNIVPRTTA